MNLSFYRKDLEIMDIHWLENLKADLEKWISDREKEIEKIKQKRIEELDKEIADLQDLLCDVNCRLEDKQAITETITIIRIWEIKSGWTRIRISVENVDKNNEDKIINRFTCNDIDYSERGKIFEILENLESCHFQKIISNMNLSKKIKDKYIVEEKSSCEYW